MKQHDFQISRRQYLKQMGGEIAACTLATQPLLASSSSGRRQVLVMSDLHIGKVQDGLDGYEWLARALVDLKENVGPISYGLTLGDISQNGDRDSILKYIKLRDACTIPQWIELAGNHEYYKQGITNYTSLIRSTEPSLFIDGNIAWFFISDEENSRIGNMSPQTCRWLKKNIQIHKDKTIIVCSHQLPANTIRRSDEDVFCLHPLEFVENAKHIIARRRIHDTQIFSDEFTVKVPVRNALSLGKQR